MSLPIPTRKHKTVQKRYKSPPIPPTSTKPSQPFQQTSNTLHPQSSATMYISPLTLPAILGLLSASSAYESTPPLHQPTLPTNPTNPLPNSHSLQQRRRLQRRQQHGVPHLQRHPAQPLLRLRAQRQRPVRRALQAVQQRRLRERGV